MSSSAKRWGHAGFFRPVTIRGNNLHSGHSRAFSAAHHPTVSLRGHWCGSAFLASDRPERNAGPPRRPGRWLASMKRAICRSSSSRYGLHGCSIGPWSQTDVKPTRWRETIASPTPWGWSGRTMVRTGLRMMPTFPYQTGPSLITYSPWQRSRETVLGLPYSLAKHFD